MSDDREIARAEIPAAGPTEESETHVYTASRDAMIANVVYTPSGDIRGDWDRPRLMELRVGRFDEPGSRLIAGASAQQSDFRLPAGVPQNAELSWSYRLRVKEGEALYWTSRVLRGQRAGGIRDPGGTVEVILEPLTADGSSATKLVPDYWRDRKLAIEQMISKAPPGGGVAYMSHDTGRFVEAADGGIALEVETPETLGIDRRTYEIPYDRIMHVRLL